MDWYSWLSKTGMEPSLVYEYGLAFSRNELEEDDIAHFNHEFLLSMGISIAKHRLEILKLASKVRGSSKPRAMSRFFVAIRQAKRCLAKHIQNLVRSEDSSALVIVPRGKGGMLKRSKTSKDRRSLLTNGSRKVSNFSGPIVHNHHKDDVVDDGDWYYSTSGVDEIKWDAMFRNLKPT